MSCEFSDVFSAERAFSPKMVSLTVQFLLLTSVGIKANYEWFSLHRVFCQDEKQLSLLKAVLSSYALEDTSDDPKVNIPDFFVL